MTTALSTVTEYPHLIGGREVTGEQAPIDRRSPANGDLVARYANGTGFHVEAAVSEARASFDAGTWAHRPAAERTRVLLKAAERISSDRERLAQIEAREAGKPIRLARADVDGAVGHFEYAAALALEMRGDTYTNLGPQYVGMVVREAVGVAALIIPWNFPALIFGQKVPYALAAGCSVVVKPSEFTAGTAIEMTRLIHAAGVPGSVLNVITGYGDPVGQALVESAGVDFVSFTGSTATGKRIAGAAAGTAKKVSLELGGKGANIVFADADLDAAVDGAIKAVFFNTGECCVAGSRLLVEESVADAFLEQMVERTRALRLRDPLDEHSDLGALIHPEHADKVAAFIDSGIKEGAKLLVGGGRGTGNLASGAFIEPTIFDGVTPQMRIFCEEIFGPVLSVTRFSGVDQAIELANSTAYGLGNTVWTQDIDKALNVARAVRSGTVWINNALEGGPQLPFGGVKASGYGREMGRAGFEEFTELKTCLIKVGPHASFFS